MPLTDQEQADAQAAEYGSYVARTVIHINGARAFNPGDPVPASHVDRGIVAADAVEPRKPISPPTPASTPATTKDKG